MFVAWNALLAVTIPTTVQHRWQISHGATPWHVLPDTVDEHEHQLAPQEPTRLL
ncbi:hypothetical protein L2Y90_19085 [Burkholderia pyrrocinia]|uniref:hypothetical protein n=1 Tax=Burkholderia pyrrocinia TaxID=60550 RepID=UPI00215B6FAA|nr:hypothetical protein [Burkholderia pyrrocinia]UVE68870.1 hypothetical protein L2Y90_19085 [Burkholderia pyrrocinia]